MMNLLISAGGTGGHIIPALAVAKELRTKYDCQIHWLGAKHLEQSLAQEYNISYHSLQISALQGSSFRHKFFYPVIFLRALWQAFSLLLRLKSEAIFITGSYITVPVAVAGFVLGKPVFLQEQNALMGSASRLISRFARRVYVGLLQPKWTPPVRSQKLITSGNPLLLAGQADFPAPLPRYAARSGPLRIFITGGSQGAAVFNSLLPVVFACQTGKEFEIWHQSGHNKAAATEELYARAKLSEVRVEEFVTDMQECYTWADIVIARAGAMTISELCHVGVFAILVPYPYAIHEHQLKNALSLNGAALVINQQDFTVRKLQSLFAGWQQSALREAWRQKFAKKAEMMRKFARPRAAETITQDMLEVLRCS